MILLTSCRCPTQHSTHVAGTACGVHYGVATCTLCSVRVLDGDGSGSWSDVLRGLDRAVDNCQGRKCVANLSLGGGQSHTVDKAIRDAVRAGVVMVVAAGNNSEDACNTSPSSEPLAIAVGSTTDEDRPSSFSNYGACVDVYAPGSDILSARAGGSGGTEMSGTSMASPREFAVGVAVCPRSASFLCFSPIAARHRRRRRHRRGPPP